MKFHPFSLITPIYLISLILLIFPKSVLAKSSYWPVQSIDTMKFSRDLAREKLNDKSFEETIKLQVEKIAATGATHVAIGTPYDEEFLPFLRKWVKAARKQELKVWFRGNFSGWEGWFGYDPILPEQHKLNTRQFIVLNQDLFEDGDIFTSCTECENGGPGDPRETGDIDGFRKFLVTEYQLTKKAFDEIGKNVSSNYYSVNGDVARLVMDKKTTEKLDAVVVIDHYVADPEQLAKDLKEISERSGGQVVLGEFGAPIPNIHGYLTEKQQGEWVSTALTELAKVETLVGINYWTSFGGTTGIWSINGQEREAAKVLSAYYSPEKVSGRVVNELGRGVKGAMITVGAKRFHTDKNGLFSVLIVPSQDKLVIDAKSYNQKVVKVDELNLSTEIVLTKSRESIFFKLAKLISSLLRKWRIL